MKKHHPKREMAKVSLQEVNIPGRSYLVWCLLQEQKSSQSLCKNSVSQRSNRQKDF